MANKSTVVDEELLYTGLDYMRQGIRCIVESKNPGYSTAFGNKQYNEKGFTFLKKPFIEILGEFECIEKKINLPDIFHFSIKYSPIAQFKKWIFILSNKDFLRVSEWGKKFEQEFYFLKIEDNFFFQPILKNIAHEKFLLNLYQRTKIPETIINFSTYFDKSKKLFLYKDYLQKKVSTVKLSQDLILNHLYDVKVHYLKSLKGIKFRVTINGEKINHSIKFSSNKNNEQNIKKSSRKKSTDKTQEEYHEEVTEILKDFKNLVKSTNKFANISIGRVNKIPILINLPRKNKNMEVVIHFNTKKEIVVTTVKGEILKTFVISTSPNSNWLQKK